MAIASFTGPGLASVQFLFTREIAAWTLVGERRLVTIASISDSNDGPASGNDSESRGRYVNRQFPWCLYRLAGGSPKC